MPQFIFTFSLRFVTVIYTPTRIHCYSCYIVLDTEMQALSLKLPLLHLFRSLYEKRCPQFFLLFLLCFVTVIYTPTRIHRYSRYIVLDTGMQALSLKLPLFKAVIAGAAGPASAGPLFLADHGIRRTTFNDRRSSAYMSLFF